MFSAKITQGSGIIAHYSFLSLFQGVVPFLVLPLRWALPKLINQKPMLLAKAFGLQVFLTFLQHLLEHDGSPTTQAAELGAERICVGSRLLCKWCTVLSQTGKIRTKLIYGHIFRKEAADDFQWTSRIYSRIRLFPDFSIILRFLVVFVWVSFIFPYPVHFNGHKLDTDFGYSPLGIPPRIARVHSTCLFHFLSFCTLREFCTFLYQQKHIFHMSLLSHFSAN